MKQRRTYSIENAIKLMTEEELNSFLGISTDRRVILHIIANRIMDRTESAYFEEGEEGGRLKSVDALFIAVAIVSDVIGVWKTRGRALFTGVKDIAAILDARGTGWYIEAEIGAIYFEALKRAREMPLSGDYTRAFLLVLDVLEDMKMEEA